MDVHGLYQFEKDFRGYNGTINKVGVQDALWQVWLVVEDPLDDHAELVMDRAGEF